MLQTYNGVQEGGLGVDYGLDAQQLTVISDRGDQEVRPADDHVTFVT